MAVDPLIAHEAVARARERRADALMRLRADARRDMDALRSRADGEPPRLHALGRLLALAGADRAILALHVWIVEQTLFDHARGMCVRHVAETARWGGYRLERPGDASLGWLLDARTNGARLGAWLMIMLAETEDPKTGRPLLEPSGPDPYAGLRG